MTSNVSRAVGSVNRSKFWPKAESVTSFPQVKFLALEIFILYVTEICNNYWRVCCLVRIQYRDSRFLCFVWLNGFLQCRFNSLLLYAFLLIIYVLLLIKKNRATQFNQSGARTKTNRDLVTCLFLHLAPVTYIYLYIGVFIGLNYFVFLDDELIIPFHRFTLHSVWYAPSPLRVFVLLTLKESSRFSPPQMSISSSYEPISKKYCLWMENKPPAIVGVLCERQTQKKQQCFWYERLSYF